MLPSYKFGYLFDMQIVFQKYLGNNKEIWKRLRLKNVLKNWSAGNDSKSQVFSIYETPFQYVRSALPLYTYADGARQFFGSNILFYPRHHFNTKKTVSSSQPIKQDQEEKKGNVPNPREKIWPAFKSSCLRTKFKRKKQ